MPNKFASKRRKHALTRRSFLRVAGTTLAVSVARVAGAWSAERAGAVEDIRGEAFAETAAVRRGLERTAQLFVGDQVGTGFQSRLAMRLGRATIVRLGEQARLTLDRFLVNAGGEITLQSGPMLLDRPAGGAPLPIQIRSPFGLIAVRGTRFFAGPSNERFGVFVERGSVVVSAAGRQVVVRAGEGSDIPYPGAAPTPAVRWGEPRIRAALESVR
jgi:hypothetical protein